MGDKDYYAILQVPRGAPATTIEAAYWELARRYSASLDDTPRVADLIELLNEAYRVLATPDLRCQYNQSLGVIAPEAPEPIKGRFLGWLRRALGTLGDLLTVEEEAPAEETAAGQTGQGAAVPEAAKPEPAKGGFLRWLRKTLDTPRDMPPGMEEAPAKTATAQVASKPDSGRTVELASKPVAPPPPREVAPPVKVEAASQSAAELAPAPPPRTSTWVRWEMPPLQSMVVSVGVLLMFVLALVAGAPLLFTLILGGLTLFFALFPWRFGSLPLALPQPEIRQQDEQDTAAALRDSTAALVARLRGGSAGHTGPSDIEGAADSDRPSDRSPL